MKKYYALGELLVDYRGMNNLTQSEVAAMLDVDVRTVARWENNESLIKTDKEDEVVEKTFIPYQVIHNLNAAVPMPVYYDFKIRKYSLTGVSKALPDAEWFRLKMDATSPRVRATKTAEDVEVIAKYHRFLYNTQKPVRKSLILEAARLFPEINLIMYDAAGYYAGHRVVFPISDATFQKLRNREMVEGELREKDLQNYKTSAKPVFYAYSTYADSNENSYYMVGSFLRFIKSLGNIDYIYAVLAVRYDSIKVLEDMGLKKVWEDKAEQERLGLVSPPTFFEGKLHDFLKYVE